MKAVDSNPPLKKLKSCCTSSLLWWASLLVVAGIGNTRAEDISAPPPQGSQTQSEQTEAQAPPPPLPSEEPASDDSRNLPQTDVRIIHEKDKTVEEYRVGGQLRYVKIIPRQGKPYYLVDRDGDGVLESRFSDLKGPPPVNQWLLLEW